MNVTLWMVQVLLAIVFAVSAAIKGTQSKQRSIDLGMTGVADVSLATMRFVAISEVFGVIGLLAPFGLGIVPILTPLAAVGLGVIMVLAARIHWQRGRTLDQRRSQSARRGRHNSRRPIFRLEQFRPAAPLAGFLPTNYEQERFYRDLAAVDARRDSKSDEQHDGGDHQHTSAACRYERRIAAGNVMLLGLCLVVAVGRWPL